MQDCREGQLFEEDDELTLVKSLSKEMETKVKEQGVTQLKSLFDLLSDPPRRKHLIKHTKYLSVKKAHQWFKILSDAPLLPGICEPKIDHRRVTNPYTSCFPPNSNLPPDEEQGWEKNAQRQQ